MGLRAFASRCAAVTLRGARQLAPCSGSQVVDQTGAVVDVVVVVIG
jgi:hypothetical protein